MDNLGIVTREVTVPLNGMPESVRGAAWSEVYKRMALWGSLFSIGGGAVAYALAKPKKKVRHTAYGALAGGIGAAGVTLLIGWRRISSADELWDYVAEGGGIFPQ